MASLLSSRRAELILFLQIMVSEGLVNNEFLQLQNMKLSRGRDIVIRSVILYWRAARKLFTQMSYQLDMNEIDFYDVLDCALDLLQRSNSIGGVLVSTACTDISDGCHAKDKDRCINGLTTAKREFARLQVKFESVLELERIIIECEDMQDKRAQAETNQHELPN